MAQRRQRQKQLSLRDFWGVISDDFAVLFRHINDLGLFLVGNRRTRIFLRVSIAIFCAAILMVARVKYDNQPIVGDQPHYLLMTYSLVHDHDFNLANNFLHHDADLFGDYGPKGLTPDGQIGPGQIHTPTHQYSVHGIGLPLLITPGYLIGGVYGVQVEMILIAVCLLYLVYYWSKTVTGSIKFSLLASGVLFVSYHFYGLAGYIFPDAVMATIIVSTLLIITKAPYSFVWQLVLGLLLGFGVLVHFKMLLFAIPAVLVLAYRTWKYNRQLPYLTALPLVLFVALFLYQTHEWFGVWNPQEIDADVGGDVKLNPLMSLNFISAMLLDAARGLIANSPILLFILIGIPVWFNRRRETFLVVAICIVPLLLILSSLPGWGGGDAPVGRYLMEFIPALMPALALAVQLLRALWSRIAFAGLLLGTLLITLYFIHLKKSWLGVTSPTSSPILLNTWLSFDRWLPQFDGATMPMGPYDWLKTVVSYFALLALMLYAFFVSRRPSVATPAAK